MVAIMTYTPTAQKSNLYHAIKKLAKTWRRLSLKEEIYNGGNAMRKAYKIILTPDAYGYFVSVPDFNCNTQGKDIADALYMARDVIGAMGMSLHDMGKDIPEPDSTSFEMQSGDILTYVDVDFNEYRKKLATKRIKKTLTIPSWLNEKAEAENINFSRLLEEALINKLNV